MSFLTSTSFESLSFIGTISVSSETVEPCPAGLILASLSPTSNTTSSPGAIPRMSRTSFGITAWPFGPTLLLSLTNLEVSMEGNKSYFRVIPCIHGWLPHGLEWGKNPGGPDSDSPPNRQKTICSGLEDV